MGKLSYNEIQAQLKTLPDWEYLEDRIEKGFSFDTYLAVIDFVNRIAAKAGVRNHPLIKKREKIAMASEHERSSQRI